MKKNQLLCQLLMALGSCFSSPSSSGVEDIKADKSFAFSGELDDIHSKKLPVVIFLYDIDGTLIAPYKSHAPVKWCGRFEQWLELGEKLNRIALGKGFILKQGFLSNKKFFDSAADDVAKKMQPVFELDTRFKTENHEQYCLTRIIAYNKTTKNFSEKFMFNNLNNWEGDKKLEYDDALKSKTFFLILPQPRSSELEWGAENKVRYALELKELHDAETVFLLDDRKVNVDAMNEHGLVGLFANEFATYCALGEGAPEELVEKAIQHVLEQFASELDRLNLVCSPSIHLAPGLALPTLLSFLQRQEGRLHDNTLFASEQHDRPEKIFKP